MKKGVIITIIVIVAILALAAIFFLHRTSNPASPPSPQQQTQVSGVTDSGVNAIGQDVTITNESDFSDSALDGLG